MIGTIPNDVNSARDKVHQLGISPDFVRGFYNRYGHSSQAKMICNFLGTSPEAMRDDAMNLVGGSSASTQNGAKSTQSTKFPRLK